MNRRIAVAALAALTLTTVSAGAYVTNKWLRDPFLDFKDTQNHVWHLVDQRFRGQVKQYDARGNSLGSYGSDMGGDKNISARVMVDGETYALKGAGRYTLRDTKGTVVGYAELAPETTAQRDAGQAEYLKRAGIDEVLSIPHGDNDGETQTIGFFGDHREITFCLTGGPVQARFNRTDNGHVIMNALVEKPLPNHSPDAPPVFQWTQNGVAHKHYGFGEAATFTLPGGIPVRVVVVARAGR